METARSGAICPYDDKRMPPTVAIIAALPREIAALVRGTKPDAGLLSHGIHLFRMRNAVLVAGGMGASRAALAVEAALADGGVQTLISTGLAGACSSQLAAGAVVEANEVIDAQTGERFSTASSDLSCVLATTATIASISEKSRLAASYGAALVDMEAATVGRLALAHGLEFRAIKAISDAHDFELSSLSRFAGKYGRFRTGAFALHTALRPAMWTKAAQLGRDSNRALASLHTRLLELIED
jgi:adenosylhomocysteine nucleosidase